MSIVSISRTESTAPDGTVTGVGSGGGGGDDDVCAAEGGSAGCEDADVGADALLIAGGASDWDVSMASDCDLRRRDGDAFDFISVEEFAEELVD